jgi:hypothetical protein
MALVYLLSVLTALVVLAVAMRPRRAPAPVPPAPAPAAALAVAPGAEVRVILAAATQLATRLDTAA